MNVNSSDVKSNVQKLLHMGFDNESRIEEALVTANNDIDSAISILVNGILDTQSSEARLSDREESSSDADFSTSATDEFPVAEYSRLEASVFVEKWNIPCLRSQSFGICLQSSIRLVEKQGIVVFSKVEELKRFVTTCLDECLKKLLTSSAVLTWDAETLEGVHNMLELVVQLAAEFLKAVYVSLHSNDQRDSVVTTPSFNLPSGKTLIEAVCNAYDKPFEQTEANVHLTTVFMRYLNLIFDPECSYHQRCRDRATNTGTYIDEFNHWIPSPDIRQADAEVYAEVLPAPKNFYLVNLINCFGMCGGFPVLRWLSTRRFTSLDQIHVTLLPLSNAADYLTTSCLLRYATWPMVRTLWKLNNLTAEDLKRQGVQVFEMTTCLRVLCYRITSLKLPASEACVAPITTEEVCTPCQPDWDQLMSRCQTDADLLATLKMLFSVPLIDELHLSLLLTSLCPPVGAVGGSFANRLLAISQLIDLLTAVQSSRSDRDRSDVRSVSSGGTSRRFTGSASLLAMENMAFLNRRKIHRLVRCETLMSWLKDKHVIQRLMTNLDNETYMSKIAERLRCLRERITQEDITVLGKCLEDHNTNLDNETYMSKIAELLRCLRERITLEDITVLWKCQEGQSAAAVTNILQLLADVGACCFSQPQLDHLFNLIRGNWLSLDLQVSIQFTRSRTNPTRQSIGEAGGGGGGGSMRRRRASKCFPRHLPEPTTVRHARAGLLNLISTIGLNSREPWVSDQCLKLLWQLAHGLRPQDIATSLVSPTRSRQSADAGVPATAASSAVEEVEEATTAAPPPQQATPHHHRHSGRTKHALGKFIHGLGTTSVSVTLDSSVKQYVHPEPTEAALSQLLTVLRDSHLPAQEQRPRQASWLALAAEELKHGKLAFFLLSFVRTILELILKPLPGRTKKEHLRELNRNHSLIDTVCNSLHRYHKQAVSRHGQALSASSENEFGVPHGDLIKRHLSLLHYLLTVADVHLSLDRAQCIWETLTNDSHYSAYGLEECLSWFAGAIDLLEQDAQTAIFTKHFLKLDPTQLHSLTGFKCFETFFVRVNLNENRLKMHGDVWKVERMDLMGMDLLWDLYTSFPPAPQVTHSLTSPRDLGQANANLLGSGAGAATGTQAGSSGYAAKLVQSPATPCTRNDVVHGVNLRTAVLLSRQLLLDVSWCRLAQRLRREPDTCHKRFFDACRKRISANLSIMQDSKANSPNSLRTLLADTGQMLASLLVGPKAASTARTRHARCSKLALHRLLYLVHAYIQKSEDDLIGDRPPPPYWRPHYLTFRGWELRLPLHIYASNGQPIVLSNLPLSSDNLSAPFSLCLSDVAQQYQQNPILVMHSNATLGAVRDRAAIMASACVYARRTLLVSDSTASTGTLQLENPALLQFTYGLERLALGPTGALGAPRRLQNTANAPPPSGGGGSCQLSTTNATTETETPLGHNFDRKPIGEIGFQTGRPLIIRLQLADASVKEPCPTSGTSSGGSSVCNLDSVASAYSNSRSAMDVSASPRRSSGASIRSGASLSLSQRFSFGSSTAPPHPPQKVSSANPAVGGVNVTGGSQPLDSPLPLKPLALPSITLASGASVYDLLFELAEADLQELTAAAHEASRCGSASGGGSSEDEPRQPSLLHLTRLLLYCLPTYNPATQTASSTWLGSHTTTGLMPPSATAPGGGKAAVSPMICTPENVIKAPQFRLLYMLQVLSSELVTRETSAWWESVQAVAGASIGPSVTPVDLGGGGGGHADSVLEQPELIDLQRSSSGIVKRSSFAFIESAAVGERVRPKLLISSESCLSMPTTLNGELGPTSAPPSPGVERKRHNRFIGKFSLRWPGPGSASSGKSKQPPELVGMSTPVQSYDWLEPLVIVLRRQLAFMPSLTPSNLTGLVMPGLFPFSGPESSTRDSRCADWICREIKHLCLQILATLLNPAPRRNADSTLANSRSSSVSSVCSTLAMASSGFAAKFVSVVLDTALASADITDSARPDRVSTARGSLSGSSCRRRGPKLQHVESNAGVTNVLDPLAVTDVALTCQDVEIAVQSIRLLCQSVLSYPSYFMGAFMQLPQLGHSLLRLLLHSPSVRIRAETCHQLEQLFQLEAFQQQYNFPASSATWAPVQHRNSAFGVEACCYLFQRDLGKSPMFLSQISLEEAQASALLDALFTVLFNPTSAMPPFWSTQLAYLSDADRRFTLQCSEFFRLRGRLAALAEQSCLQHYAGVDTLGVFENEIQWFRTFASANAPSQSWDEKVYPSTENALLCGHLRFLRIACYQLVSSLLLRSNLAGPELGLAAGGPPPFTISTTATTTSSQPASGGFYMGEPTDYCRTCPRPSTCQGLFPPSSLLPLLRTKNLDSSSQDSDNPRFAFDLRSRGATGTMVDPSALLTARCLRCLRDLVPHLLFEYLFSAAFCMLEKPGPPTACLVGADAAAAAAVTPEILANFTSALTHFTHSQSVSEQQAASSLGADSRLTALLRPPARKLAGRARREAFLLLLFLCRMDFACLEATVEILVRLHHSRYSHTSTAGVAGSGGSQPRGLFSLSSSNDLTDFRRPTSTGSPSGSSGDGGSNLLQVAPAQSQGTAAAAAVAPVVWDVTPVLSGRAICNFTGLRNGGATCYMNSILQQLFMQPGVPETLLSVSSGRLEDSNLLYRTQELFLNLMYSQLQFYDPASFWHSFRMWGTDNPIDPREQQDAFDFFQALTDQLDENLKKLNEEPLFSKVFHGTLSDSMFCEDCGHRYDREQSFSAINIPTSAGDLVEALKQYVQEEVLDGENAYFCERCQLKQRTVKRLTFNSLPPVLCLQLKRFGFDWDRQVSVKYNQYFSFPRRLDMSPFSGDSVLMQPLRSLNSSGAFDLQQRRSVDESLTDVSSRRGFHLFDLDDEEEQPIVNAPADVTDAASTSVPNEAGFWSNPTPATGGGFPSAELQEPPSSLYELVGVVIHSGQAHAGHYYSFIRDRGRHDILDDSGRPWWPFGSRRASINYQPKTVGAAFTTRRGTLVHGANDHFSLNEDFRPQRWLKFNDTVVEEVELTDEFLEQECFGGVYTTQCPGRPPEKRTRNWNAYMLFYQRVSNPAVGFMGSRPTPETIFRPRRISESSYWLRKQSKGNADHVAEGSLEKEHFLKPELPDGCSGPRPGRRPTGTGATATLGISPRLLAPPLRSPASSTCLVALMEGTDAHRSGDLQGATTPEASGDVFLSPKGITTAGGHLSGSTSGSDLSHGNTTTTSHHHLMFRRVRSQNLELLCNKDVYTLEYTSFVHTLARGILADTCAAKLEPQRVVLGARLVANFLFITYLPLSASVKVAITPASFSAPTSVAPPSEEQQPRPAGSSMAQATKLTQNASRLDHEWMELLAALMTANSSCVNWAMHFFLACPTQPLRNFLLGCPKPLIRHQVGSLIGLVLHSFYASKDASILDTTLNQLVDHLLSFVDGGLRQYDSQCASFFGLLRGYADSCAHASVHLSNLLATSRLLSLLLDEATASEDTARVSDGICFSVPIARPASLSKSSAAAENTLIFPTWASRLRPWSMNQSKEWGNYYQLLGHMILQTNFDHYRNPGSSSAAVSATGGGSNPLRLSLFPQPQTARWLGLPPLASSGSHRSLGGLIYPPPSSSASSSSAPVAASIPPAPPNLRFVGLYLLIEAVIRVYIENPTVPTPPQFSTSPEAGVLHCPGALHGRLPSAVSVNSVLEEGRSLRTTMTDVLTHLSRSWWQPSAAALSMILTGILSRPPYELRHYFDLTRQLLRIRDDLQAARIVAVLHGIRGPACRLLPDMEDTEAFLRENATDSDAGADQTHTLRRAVTVSNAEEAVRQTDATMTESPSTSPPNFAVKGLLTMIIDECNRDPRRSYQCMKFLVELGSENPAVIDQLCRFPELWEPAVDWLRRLIESSAEAVTAAAAGPSNRLAVPKNLSSTFVPDTDDGAPLSSYRPRALTVGNPSSHHSFHHTHQNSTGSQSRPHQFSNELADDSCAFQRTSSAQSTLTEAVRMLAIMTRPQRSLQTHRENDKHAIQ